MIETISSCIRTARKQHTCSFCGCKIQPGEKYHYFVGTNDGELYEWKEHEKCSYICHAIWDFADPDDGMSEEDFKESVAEICRTFVCPDCEKYDEDEHWCGENYCLDKVYELLKKYELYRADRNCFHVEWKLRERKKDGEQE